MPDQESQVIAWMTRVFTAATHGPSLFDPACFEGVHRAVAERVGQDRLTVVLREKGASAFRLAARAGSLSTWAQGLSPGGVYAAPTPALEALLLAGETLLLDDLHTREDLFGPEVHTSRLRSYAALRVPMEGDALSAWIMFGWNEPGRATTAPEAEMRRVALLLRALVPAAHHAARAERFARMLDRLPYGVAGLDGAGRILEANGEAERLLGSAPAGTAFESLLIPADRPAFQRLLRAGSGAGTVLLWLVTREGEHRPLDVSALAVGAGGALATQLHLEDATARLANESELRARAEALSFLRDLAETAAGELAAETAVGRAAQLVTTRLPVESAVVARVDRATGRLECVADTGVPPELARALWSLPAADLERACSSGPLPLPPSLAAHAGSELAVTLLPLCHADQLVGVALFVTRGEPHERTHDLLLASARTVAVALHAGLEYAEAVRLAAERRQLLDSLPSIVFRLDPRTGATLYANAAVERVLGVPLTAALGLPGLEGLLCDETERETAAEARAAVAAGGESAWVDQRYRRVDGRIVTLRARLYRVSHGGSSGRARGEVIEGVAQDVTEEIDARKQLVHADRLRSLGMLAAGVAHEINNPAAFILLGVQQLGRMLAQMPEEPAGAQTRKRIADVLGELSDGIQRIVHIVGELKLFTRIPESAFSTPVDVNRLIASAVTLAQAELRRRARVVVELGDLPPLPGDHARLGQVFVNLLINAAQAIPPGNEDGNLVRVATRAVGQEILVEVSDTGVGIAAENLTRIFDPFFTTKAPGEGTGLGLAISYDLVRRAGGTIEVESTVGRGTTFVVRLPVRGVARARESRPQITPVPAGARVLIVEDEQHLGVAMARALASSYMVDLAQDAEAALEKLEQAAGAGEFSAVLCDLRMPGMDGVALYEQVRARWPALGERFVFLTGLGLGAEFESFVRTTDRPVLEKPFEMSELEEVVARVVGGAR